MTVDDPTFNRGDVLSTVLLGPLVNGRISTWLDDDSLVVWDAGSHADALKELLGHGAVMRTLVESDRFRETALLNRANGALTVLERAFVGDHDGSEVIDTAARPFDLEECAEPEPSDDLWAGFAEWLSSVVVDAAMRGEFVVIELGGWEHRPDPYALAAVMRPDDGEWISNVETSPVPSWSDFWPPAEEGLEGQTVTAPASRETVEAASILLVEAVRGWAGTPYRVAVTFGIAPWGPWTNEEPVIIAPPALPRPVQPRQVHAAKKSEGAVVPEKAEFFSADVAAKLGTYVYRLIDPRNGETFYVGKGKGNRVFAHIRVAQDLEGDALDNKTMRIYEIRNAGFAVGHVIHRHGMDDRTAFEVEGALIAAYPGLPNIAGGAGNSDRGVMHAREIIRRYEAEPAVFHHKALLINVNRSSAEIDLYEATRYAWKISATKAA